MSPPRWALRLSRFMLQQVREPVSWLRALNFVTTGQASRETVHALLRPLWGQRVPALARRLNRDVAGLRFAKVPLRVARSVRHPLLVSVPALAQLTGQPWEWFSWLADTQTFERCSGEKLRHYDRWWLPRKKGPARLIEAPKQRLKVVQRVLLREVLSLSETHPAAHGCVRGRDAHSRTLCSMGLRATGRMGIGGSVYDDDSGVGAARTACGSCVG